jgi:group I intron endonuclease
MYYIYCIINSITGSMYIGQTSKDISRRYYEHNHNAYTLNKKNKLYDAIRKYGKDTFYVVELETVTTKTQANLSEILYIEQCQQLGINLYNMTKGGDGGFVVPEEKLVEWKEKLSLARQGRQPALGMKHTEENKKLFSEVSNKYWNEHRKYTTEQIISAGSFKTANELYGISKTHYYRLIKRV